MFTDDDSFDATNRDTVCVLASKHSCSCRRCLNPLDFFDQFVLQPISTASSQPQIDDDGESNLDGSDNDDSADSLASSVSSGRLHFYFTPPPTPRDYDLSEVCVGISASCFAPPPPVKARPLPPPRPVLLPRDLEFPGVQDPRELRDLVRRKLDEYRAALHHFNVERSNQTRGKKKDRHPRGDGLYFYPPKRETLSKTEMFQKGIRAMPFLYSKLTLVNVARRAPRLQRPRLPAELPGEGSRRSRLRRVEESDADEDHYDRLSGYVSAAGKKKIEAMRRKQPVYWWGDTQRITAVYRLVPTKIARPEIFKEMNAHWEGIRRLAAKLRPRRGRLHKSRLRKTCRRDARRARRGNRRVDAGVVSFVFHNLRAGASDTRFGVAQHHRDRATVKQAALTEMLSRSPAAQQRLCQGASSCSSLLRSGKRAAARDDVQRALREELDCIDDIEVEDTHADEEDDDWMREYIYVRN